MRIGSREITLFPLLLSQKGIDFYFLERKLKTGAERFELSKASSAPTVFKTASSPIRITPNNLCLFLEIFILTTRFRSEL